jgi:hypothetical protein
MMKTVTAIHNGGVLLMVLLVALLIQPIPPAHAEDSQVKGTMVLTPIEDLNVPKGKLSILASGAAEDTLNACKARIPELASAGQYLLAEQSCVGAEQTRNEIRSAPKF